MSESEHLAALSKAFSDNGPAETASASEAASSFPDYTAAAEANKAASQPGQPDVSRVRRWFAENRPWEGKPGSWVPADLGPVLDGSYQAPVPSVGARSDGHGLFYPGRLHALGAEPEAGKSWLACLACAQEILKGSTVVYVDFEDDAAGIGGRMLALRTEFRTDPSILAARFAYICPSEPLFTRWRKFGDKGIEEARSELDDFTLTIRALRPSLVIFDGTTEALALHGLNVRDETDVAEWQNRVLRPVARLGPAVVWLDHPVKDRESRGRFDIGSEHKLAMVDGASYALLAVRPFGIGMEGCSDLYIRKDKPGQLRRQGRPGRDGLCLYGRLTVTGDSAEVVHAAVYPPADAPVLTRPTVFMERVSRALEAHQAAGGKVPSQNEVRQMVPGDHNLKAQALLALEREHHVTVADGPNRSRRYTLVTPFRNDGHALPDPSSS